VLRSDLAALEAECGQELRRSVYNNYKPFIEASQVGMDPPASETSQMASMHSDAF
jgi:hypothetical protein